MKNNNYIPVLVKTSTKKEIWQMDISNLNIEELLKLKEELIGTIDCSIRGIDYTIYQESNIDRYLSDRKDKKRTNKNRRQRIRKKTRERKERN